MKKLYPNSDFASMVRDGTDSFLLVFDRVGGGPGSLENAVVLDGDKVVWNAALAPNRKWTPWPNTVPEGRVAFANRRILDSYIDGDEAFMVVNQMLLVFDKEGHVRRRVTTF